MPKFFLRDIANDTEQEASQLPVLVGGVWECGSFRSTDPTGTLYEAVTVADAAVRRITVLAFRNRFTQNEKVALEMAAQHNPAASVPQQQQAAAIRASMKDSDNAAYIDLERADTRAGVLTMCQLFQALGVVPNAAARAAVILDAEIQPIEVYHG